MSLSGFSISVSGCDSIVKKKLELYRDNPDVQLFFVRTPDTSCSLCILPAADLVSFLDNANDQRLLLPPLIAFGPAEAMSAAVDAGCSDYLCEPWLPIEFFERARLCCRAGLVDLGGPALGCRQDCRLAVYQDGAPIAGLYVPHAEYILFSLFSRNRGRFFGRESLAAILGLEQAAGSRAVDMHISRLRLSIKTLLLDVGLSAENNPLITSSGRGWGIL